MTIMAAEVGTGAVEGEAAEASTAGRTSTRTRRGGSSGPGRSRSRARSRAGGSPVIAQTGPDDFSDYDPPRQQIAQTGPTQRGFALEGAWPSSNYQGVILGEFVLAVLLVAATPFAQKNRTGVSPYAGKDMIQLLAITVLYFLLAVMAGASQGAARFAAWFGGLILLVVGLAEAANIASAVSKYLNPGTSSGQGVAEGSAGPILNRSVVNPGLAEGSAGPLLSSPTGISRGSAQQPGTGLS